MNTMEQLMLISEIYVKWRKRFVFSKSLLCIWCLALAFSFVEYRVVAILMDILNDIWEEGNLRRAAIFTNLQDGLSSLFFTCTHVFAAYAGHFRVIIFCTPSYVMGLMLLLISILTSKVGILISLAAILLIAFGNAGVPILVAFLEYQLKEVVRERQSKEVNKERPPADIIEQKDDHLVRVTIWWRSARILGALLATISPQNIKWLEVFMISVLAMIPSYIIFCSGFIFYAFEEPTGTPLTQIYRVFKAAFWKLRIEYPADGSLERYYWKNLEPKHTYLNRRRQVQLLPHVSSLWRWLDKAAIILEPQSTNRSPESQEMKGGLCTVKEVREVKRFASLIHLSFTLLPCGMVVAAGNTFFVEQSSNLRSTLNLSFLFLLKSIARDVVLFLIWLKKSTKKGMTKVRVGVGMAVAVICCIIAFVVEHQRLSLVEKSMYPEDEISMGTEILIPQFLLLGLMEALVDCGLEQLFDDYVPESMWSFDKAFSRLVLGIGKLLTVPCLFIITGWFKEHMNTSHLDRYYQMLAILNSAFIFIYGYYAIKYKEDYPADEEMTMAEMQEIARTDHQAGEEDAKAILDVVIPDDGVDDIASYE